MLGDGGMIIAPPSVRSDGAYRWLNDLPIAEAPTWLAELVREEPPDAEPEADIERIADALATIPNDDDEWDRWNYIGMATWRATGGDEAGYIEFEQWSAKSGKHDAKTTRERWQHYFRSPPTQLGAGTLFHLAHEAAIGAAQPIPPHLNGGNGAAPPPSDGAAAAQSDPWPVLEEHAFHGLAGEVVARILPNTESDAAALLLQYLTSFGNAIGRRSYYQIEQTKHYTNLFAVLVGQTSTSRKGTSARRIRAIFEIADREWARNRVLSGMSSGEGLVWAVRDAVYAMRKGEEELIDPGVTDKRLYLIESEFYQALTTMKREGSTQSRIVRDAWDCVDVLGNLTKHSPTHATEAMISIVGHITANELRQSLDHTSMSNGYANRFLFACVKRSKLLPHGGDDDDAITNALGESTKQAIAAAKQIWRVTMTQAAARSWDRLYTRLTKGGDDLLNSIILRAAPQTLRLALIYALLDQKRFIDVEHLEAATAVWDFCEASARHIFGGVVGDPAADTILRSLQASGSGGLSRVEIHNLFGRHLPASKISAALVALMNASKVRRDSIKAGGAGRPTETWFAV